MKKRFLKNCSTANRSHSCSQEQEDEQEEAPAAAAGANDDEDDEDDDDDDEGDGGEFESKPAGVRAGVDECASSRPGRLTGVTGRIRA